MKNQGHHKHVMPLAYVEVLIVRELCLAIAYEHHVK